jgi:DNA processing protein
MKASTSELAYWLGLWRMEGIGPVSFKQIVEKYSTLTDYFENFPAQKLKIDQKLVESDLKWNEEPHCHILTIVDEDYPKQLKEIYSPPPLLFIKGDVTTLSQQQIGMVGSRNPTLSGIDTAYQFAKAFVKAGMVITSGLAIGIDGACHEGALEGDGKTIAVMGTGPEEVYPRRHQSLAQKIIEKGCLVTEFPTGTPPTASNFPRRNRLISGLSLGTLVVEAAFASGSLVTAKYALEQNKEVFAIPGSIQNPLARGCHALIKQGAKLVETAQDVLEELQLFAPKMESFQRKETDPFLEFIGFESTPVDLIIQRSNLTAEKVSSILLMLELKGLIANVPGGYIRLN